MKHRFYIKLSRCAILEIVVIKMAYPCEPQLFGSITRFYKQFLEKLGVKFTSLLKNGFIGNSVNFLC